MYHYLSPDHEFLASRLDVITPNNVIFDHEGRRIYSSSLIDNVQKSITCWDNLYILGDSVLNHVKGYNAQTVDFYIIGCKSHKHYRTTYNYITSLFTNVKKYKFAVVGKINDVNVRLMMVHNSTVFKAIDSIDIDICKMSYTKVDNKPVIQLSYSCIVSLYNKCVYIHTMYVSPFYIERILYHYYNGFKIAWVDKDITQTNAYKKMTLHIDGQTLPKCTYSKCLQKSKQKEYDFKKVFMTTSMMLRYYYSMNDSYKIWGINPITNFEAFDLILN